MTKTSEPFDNWLDKLTAPNPEAREELQEMRDAAEKWWAQDCTRICIPLAENPKFAAGLQVLLEEGGVGFTPTHCILQIRGNKGTGE